MPSDPSGGQPRSTLVRLAPDYFDDNLAIAGAVQFQVPPAPTNSWWTVALFNDANTGVVFKVYAITASSEGGGGIGLFWVHGPVGTLFQAAQPIRPDHGSLFGQIYTQSITGSASLKNTLITEPIIGDIGAAGFDSATVPFTFPAFIVPVGWSLVAANLGSDNQGGAFFWYQQANE